MRVTSIGLWADDEEVGNFSYDDPFSLNPYMLRAVIGLDADDLTPGFYGFGQANGRRFYNIVQGKREIVMRIVLNPNSDLKMSFSQLRDNLYKAISSSRSSTVTVRLSAGATSVAQVEGRIVKFEVPINSQTPELQITVQCTDPTLRAINPVLLEQDDFPNPLTNPIEITDGISTAPHGVELEFEITSAISQFRLRSEDSDWFFEVVYDFEIGDILRISSLSTLKEVRVIRSSVDTFLGDKINPASVWPVLFPGSNKIFLDQVASVDMVYAVFWPVYWGV